MTDTASNLTAWKTARLWQPLVCCAMLSMLALSVGVLEFVLNSSGLPAWVDRKMAESTGYGNHYERLYLDVEDRVMLHDVPTLDPSRGNVLFFGASVMKWGMRAPDLPPEERRLVHNFGVGEGSPWFHQQFLEYLVKYRNLEEAGADKTLVVYATCFLNARVFEDDSTRDFPNMWRRDGLYEYDFVEGIKPIPMPSWVCSYLSEKARCTSFVRTSLSILEHFSAPQALRKGLKAKRTPEYIAGWYQGTLEKDWKDHLSYHRKELQAFYDYVHGQGMHFKIVLMPLASWHRGMHYPAEYAEMIREFCKTNKLPPEDLVDLSNLVSDDDFAEHIHLTEQGLNKQHAALMEIARSFLKGTGALP